MKDFNGSIQYKGQEYKIVFNLNVMEQIQEKYGSIAEWGEKTDGASGEPDAKAVKFGFMCMLNEGIEIENEENGTDIPLLTMNKVGRMMTEIGLENAVEAINDTVVCSTESTEKNE